MSASNSASNSALNSTSNSANPAEFKASGRFDAAREDLMAKYKESDAKTALESAVRDHVARLVQTNPDILRNPREAVAQVYREVRQSMRMATLNGTVATNEFVDRELEELEQVLTAEWSYPIIE